MLADRGVLRAGEDAYEVVGDVGELQVPETLHALVASRLDTLGPEQRALAQDAAVLGKTFTLESLAAVSGADTAAIELALQELVRREFLLHEADPRSPERGQYGFVQSIIREVAYGMLSKADRRERHLATAHHFEAAGDDELAGVVAAHYTEALKASSPGPDADALAARARDWLGQAAERATALGSPGQALAFAEEALAITPASRERAELLRQASDAARDALQREQHVTYLEEAVDVLHALGDADAEVATMGRLAGALGDQNRLDEVRSLVDRMRERLGDGGDDLARAELEHAIGILHYFDGENEDCLASLDRALTGFERARAWDRFQKAISEKSAVLGFVGRQRECQLLHPGATGRRDGGGRSPRDGGRAGQPGPVVGRDRGVGRPPHPCGGDGAARRLRRAGDGSPGELSGSVGGDRRLGQRPTDRGGAPPPGPAHGPRRHPGARRVAAVGLPRRRSRGRRGDGGSERGHAGDARPADPRVGPPCSRGPVVDARGPGGRLRPRDGGDRRSIPTG